MSEQFTERHLTHKMILP